MLRTLSVCFVLAFAACNRPNWDTPVAAYQSFLRALEKGETELAYGALSTPTRELLQQRAEEISKASGGSVRNDPAAVFFMNAARPPAVREVKLLREEGSRAVLAVESGGKTHEVSMVKEAGGWRIDLPAAVPAPADSAVAAEPADAGVTAIDAGR